MKPYHNVTSRYSASFYNVLSLVYQIALLSHRPVLLSVTYIFIKKVRILLHIGGQEVCRCPNKKQITSRGVQGHKLLSSCSKCHFQCHDKPFLATLNMTSEHSLRTSPWHMTSGHDLTTRPRTMTSDNYRCTWPWNMTREHDSRAWPLPMASEHDFGLSPQTITGVHDHATWPWNMTAKHDFGPWPGNMTSQHDLRPWPRTITAIRDQGAWPWNTKAEDDLGPWPWNMTVECESRAWPWTMALVHDLGTWPQNMNSQHQLKACTVHFNWEPKRNASNMSPNCSPEFKTWKLEKQIQYQFLPGCKINNKFFKKARCTNLSSSHLCNHLIIFKHSHVKVFWANKELCKWNVKWL